MLRISDVNFYINLQKIQNHLLNETQKSLRKLFCLMTKKKKCENEERRESWEILWEGSFRGEMKDKVVIENVFPFP